MGVSHPKAMPVILAARADAETWKKALADEAQKPQRPPEGGGSLPVASRNTQEGRRRDRPGDSDLLLRERHRVQ